jgi:peptidyl-prolyl cis-trans isomerase SurA
MLAAAILWAPAAQGQTLDRVVAAVGNTAITASDVKREYQLELFFGGKTATTSSPSASALDQVRQRLIDRILLEDEVRTDGIKVPADDPAVNAGWNDLQKKFPSPQAFASAHKELGMSPEDLRQVLAGQEEILRLIDQRLRPQAIVEPSEIETYYDNTLIPSLTQQGGRSAPPLSEVEGRIREILVQQKIDSLLDEWLKRLRARGDVRVFGSAAASDMP